MMNMLCQSCWKLRGFSRVIPKLITPREKFTRDLCMMREFEFNTQEHVSLPQERTREDTRVVC